MAAEEEIGVLVVEDSLYMQRQIVRMLESEPGLRVVGVARDGFMAVDLVERLDPAVITMDINMPKLNGLEAVERIMATRPKPIVILSSYTKIHGRTSMEALELGAVDIVEKPNGSVSLDIDSIRAELVAKVKTASRVRVVRNVRRSTANGASPVGKVEAPRRAPSVVRRRVPPRNDPILCIASSTGGPRALSEVLSGLPADFPAPVVVAQHIPGQFVQSFVEQLDTRCALRVREATRGDEIMAGTVLLAPGSNHMTIGSHGRIDIMSPDYVSGPSPSANLLFEAIADRYGASAIGVVLTGMGSDGAKGALAIRRAGGITIAQDEESCVVFGMPKAAIEAGGVDFVLPLDRIGPAILEAVERKPIETGSVT